MPPTPPLPPARKAALGALKACLTKRTDIQAAVDMAVSPLADARDVALATELAYGVTRLLSRLDALLDHFLNQPDKLPPAARMVLRTAAYELTQLRVPDYATLDWAVNAIKRGHGGGLGRLANGVLRNVQRLGADANAPEFYAVRGDEIASLARWYACPPWLAEHWLAEFGPDGGRKLLEAQLHAPPVGLRVNRRKPGAEALAAKLADRKECLVHNGMTVALQPASPVDADMLRQGLVSRQSAAAQQALSGLRPEEWPQPVWDACCGRGGKTMALLEMGVPAWASDMSRGRLRQLAPEARRLGLPVPPVFLADATSPPLKSPPGTILLDAPCTGLGVVSRRPDTKWGRTPQDLDKLAALQQRMLQACADLLRSGGMLAYITCTTAKAENQDAVRHVLGTGLELVDERPADTGNELREFFYSALLRRV